MFIKTCFLPIVLPLFSKIFASSNNKHEIRSSTTNLCLSLTQNRVMAAFDPSSQNYGAFYLLTWEICNSDGVNGWTDPGQLFEFNADSQLIADNDLCVSTLPINTNIHGSDLDPCGTWLNYSEAGSYLFAIDCLTPGSAVNSDYQNFSYNVVTGQFQSACPHNLKIGSVQDVHGRLNAFLTNTNSDDTFASAQVNSIDKNSDAGQSFEATAIIIATNQMNDDSSGQNAINIEQNKRQAVVQILSEFLTTNDAQEVSQHGCWCSKIMGSNPDFAGDPVDNIDRLCKEWSVTRRCNSLENGGSCPRSTYNPKNLGNLINYTIKRAPTNAGKIFSCETIENNLDNCLKDSCLIDATYAVAIYEAIEIEIDNNGGWNGISQNDSQCARSESGNVSGNTFDLMCAGQAPILEIERL